MHAVDLGTVTCYILGDSRGRALVNAGNKADASRLWRYMARSGIDPAQIGLVVITSPSRDHVGGVGDVLASVEAPVILHRSALAALRENPLVSPEGATTFVPRLMEGEELDIGRYVPGVRLVSTPGPRPGSISVVFDGRAVVGDLIDPAHLGRSSAPVECSSILAGWRLLLDLGIVTAYPTRGNPVDAPELREAYERGMGRTGSSRGGPPEAP